MVKGDRAMSYASTGLLIRVPLGLLSLLADLRGAAQALCKRVGHGRCGVRTAEDPGIPYKSTTRQTESEPPPPANTLCVKRETKTPPPFCCQS